MIRAETKQGEFIFWCDVCDAETKKWNMEKPFPHRETCGRELVEDVKIRPAEMIRDYRAGLSGLQIAEKWHLNVSLVTKIITERGITWKYPASRNI